MTPRNWDGARWALDAPLACKRAVWRILVEAQKRRPLTTAERRLRCASQPHPWRDLGISASAYYRRRRRAAALRGD